MNKNRTLSAICCIASLTLFAFAYMSYQNSRMTEALSMQTTTIGHELLELRDHILNYQTQQSRLHYQTTQQIIKLEKEAKQLSNQAMATEWYPLSQTTPQTLEGIRHFEQSLDLVTDKLDMLVGVQVAHKYAQLSLNSLFNEEIKKIKESNVDWHFIDFLNQNLLQDHIAHPQIKMFANQLNLVRQRQTALQIDLLNEHNYEFIEATETQLRSLAHQELNHALTYCLAAVFALISLIALQAYQRFVQLRKLNHDMAIASEKALNAAKAKSQFLATMSHELRTPMNGVLGIAQIIDSETKEAATKKNIHIILDSGQHLLTVLNDILDFSKIGENKLTLESAPFSLQQVIDPVVSAVKPLAEEKNLELRVENSVPPHSQYLGDSARLRQILFNLTGNAIKFTAKGHVSLAFKASNSDPHQLVIAVADTGIGIAKEKHDAVFESFEQADTSTTRQFGGSGLGLAIVKKLTELMNGEIKLESSPNQGTIFTLTLPIEKAPQFEQEELAATNPDKAVARPLTILLAEDNRVNAIVAKGFCAKLGHNVEVAENGKVATQMATQKHYDLILMDNHMPEMNGVQATRYLRNEAGLKTLIFAYTADVFREAHDDFIAAGADHVLTKPLQRASFTDALQNFSHRLEAPQENSNVISLHRQPSTNLPLTEEELSKSSLLAEVGEDDELYHELVSSLIDDFEINIDQLITAFADKDLTNLADTLHTVKGIAFNLHLNKLAELVEEIENEVRNEQKTDVEAMQKLINRLCVNIHQAHRLLEQHRFQSHPTQEQG
ncbi:ATP-binding protein [Vibrio panuliri]|uniref:histidine kinase n=1 Tax=Vibrio panuliri TaxID=1381081 RepID=A0ABX3F656_9VIBR|nr:ATP-binding protein [Vibrio panuliri]KAB1454783.1 response regulator [Vibrio panuliri]OLQ85667.1 hybrid sensor histidine kinase/response regulator [Vibrio panuliri]